jgi:predicted  nucleic acid-binding Zn-ribbon protein
VLGETAAALYALQQIDTRIAEVERQLAALDDGTLLRTNLEELQATEERQAAELHELEKELLDAELRMKSFEEKKGGFEGRMYSGQVSNPKELGDMQREDQIEERRTSSAEARRAAEDVRQDLSQVVERFERESTRCRGELAELAERRAAAEAAVSPEALKRYEDLRPRKANLAVVLASGGVCQGCHVALATDLVRELKRGNEIHVCDNCGRVLHLPEE